MSGGCNVDGRRRPVAARICAHFLRALQAIPGTWRRQRTVAGSQRTHHPSVDGGDQTKWLGAEKAGGWLKIECVFNNWRAVEKDQSAFGNYNPMYARSTEEDVMIEAPSTQQLYVCPPLGQNPNRVLAGESILL